MREGSVWVRLSRGATSMVAMGSMLSGGLLYGQVQRAAGATPTKSETSQPAAATSGPTYEVVSIKPDPSGQVFWSNTIDGFSMGGTLLATLIRSAYGLLMPNQMIGLPGWASSEPMDVQAKMDAELAARMAKLPPMEQWQQRQKMLQALLADRFALKLHHTTKQLPVYVMTVASGGSKLKPSATDMGGLAVYASGKIEARATSMQSLAMNLSGTVGRIIEDRTGLAGGYDFTLEWAPEGAQADDPRPSIFTAMEEQLGLKLKPGQGPVDAIVIDSIQRPSEN